MNQTKRKYFKILSKSFKFFIHLLYTYSLLSCTVTSDQFSELTSEDIEDRFYIKFDVNHYKSEGLAVPLYALSSDDRIGLIDCGINKDDESVQDHYCILDLNEADIGVSGQAESGIPLQYNVPRNMCKNTTFIPPWHWNQRSGLGPQEIHECKLTSEGENAQERTFIRVPDSKWVEQTEEQEQNCEYDLSKSGGANCCFGKANAIPYKGIGVLPSSCTLDIESEPTEKEWNGDIKDCIGGPLRSSKWEAYQKTAIIDPTTLEISYELEYPIQNIFSSWTRGAREAFVVGPVIDGVVLPSSTPSANYFDGIEDLLFTTYNDCPNCPLMFFPDVSRRNEPEQAILPIGHPYFTLECLDENFETLHRVHLIIREWNTQEEFLNFAEDGRSIDPDIEGEEGSDCSYYDSDEILRDTHNRCNDFLDLDNYTTQNQYPNTNYEGSQ